MVTPMFCHEGDGFIIVREDGSVEETTYETQEARFTINQRELENNTHGAVRQAAIDLVNQLQEGRDRLSFSRIEDVAEQAGNIFDAQGRSITPDFLLEMLEGLRFSFNESGEWIKPQMIYHPSKHEAVEKAIYQLENDQNYKTKLEALIQRKRQEHNDREANRKLVD